MKKKTIFIFLLLILLSASISAAGYVIDSYDFDIKGKTQAWALRQLIIPDGEEKFASRDEMMASLNGKRQTLINKRLFSSVDYSITESEPVDDVVHVDVLFNIVDAKSIFALPYPKYDTNAGLRLGLKYYDSNILGTFSDFYGVIHATFTPWDFSTTSYHTELKLNNLYIRDAKLSFNFTGTAKQTGGISDYEGTLNVSNIVFGGGYSMNLGFGLKNTGSELQYSGSSSFAGLHISSVSISPSISLLIYEKSKASSYITPVVSVSGIKLSPMNVSFSDTFKFMNSEKFKLDTFTHSASFSFDGNLSKYGYSHTVEYKPQVHTLAFNNTFSKRVSGATVLYFYENLSWAGEDFFFSSFDTGVGISSSMTVADKISITPNLQQHMVTSYTRGSSTPSFSFYYVVSGSASGGAVNWNGNFREGLKYSFSISESWTEGFMSRTARGENIDRVTMEYFKLLWGWFNPNGRFILNYTSNSIGSKGSIAGTNSGYLGEYLRGVRNKTITDDGRDLNYISAVFNLNLLTVFPLPSFMSSWVSTYANLFVDYAFTKHAANHDAADIKHYVGVGVEGIGILRDYPNYPIRLSIGLDARKLLHYIKGESTSTDFYEIYFGLGFFF